MKDIKNIFTVYENNIEDKKQKLIDKENEYNNLKSQFEDFKNETYELIILLKELYTFKNTFLCTSKQHILTLSL